MIVVLFKDSQLERYVTRDVETRADVAHFSPCVQYLDPSRAVWDMKHLNGECGRASNGCPMCIQEKERKDGREGAGA